MRFHPSYHHAGTSPLPLDMGYLFLVGSNNLLSMVVQQRVVILEFSQEKISARPSTPPSCDRIMVIYPKVMNIKGSHISFIHSLNSTCHEENTELAARVREKKNDIDPASKI